MKQIFATLAQLTRTNIGDETESVGLREGSTLNSEHPTTILNHIGDAWRCWRLTREPDREFAFRLALHLQTLAIAIEDDLGQVLAVEKVAQKRRNNDE
jgi:hypothetical protein